MRTYSRIVKVTEPTFPVSSVLLLATGIYLTVTQWSFRTPFVIVGLITLVLMSALGPTVQGKRWQLVEKATDELPDGPVPDSLRRLIVDPIAWSSMGGAVFAAVGVVALMTIKPGLAASVAIAVTAYAVGGASGWMLVRGRPEVPVPGVAG